MRKLVQIWLVLFIANLLARPLLNYLIFRDVDLRFGFISELILIPVAQAVLLWWILTKVNLAAALGEMKTAVQRHNMLKPFLVLDALVLSAGWFVLDRAWSLNEGQGVPAYYTGAKGLMAGLLLLSIVPRSKWSGKERVYLSAFGLGLTAYATSYFFNWLTPLSNWLFSDWPLLAHWVLFYGGLFTASILVMLKIETISKRWAPDAALFLSWAPIFALAAAIVVVLNSYLRPVLLSPWSQLVKTLSFLTITAVLASVVCLRFSGAATAPPAAMKLRRQ